MNFKKSKTTNFSYNLSSSKNNNRQCFIINKTGYILKETPILNKSPAFSNLPSQIRDLVYNDIKNNIKEIYHLIDSVYEEICDLIQTGNSLSVPYDLSIDLHIETLINKLSYELLKLLNPLALKTYRRFLVRLTEHEEFDNNKEAKELLSSFELPDSEIYDKIQTWVYKLEDWILDNVNSSLNETSKSVNKSFFSDALDNIKEFFDKARTKIDDFISYTISTVQTKVDKLLLDIHGIEKYEIIESGNSNCCEHCQEMAGEIYDVDELQIGKNAPPFHPHCDCKIKGLRTTADIDEPMILNDDLEIYNRNAAIDYAINWHDKFNKDYPNFSSRGDCANFVSQCLFHGGFQMNEYWHCYLKNIEDVNPFYHLLDKFNEWNYTPAWSAAKDQYEYLKNSNIVTGETILSSIEDISTAINDSENPVKVGDVMYLKWDKDYPHHATIISRIENDMIFYAAHTSPQDYKSVAEFFKEYKNGNVYILKIR